MSIDPFAYQLGQIAERLDSGEKHFDQIDKSLSEQSKTLMKIAEGIAKFPCQTTCRYEDDCKAKQEAEIKDRKDKQSWRRQLVQGIWLAIFGVPMAVLVAWLTALLVK